MCFWLKYLGERAGLSRKVGISCTDAIGLALWTMRETKRLKNFGFLTVEEVTL